MDLENGCFPSDSSGSEAAREVPNGLSNYRPRKASEEKAFRSFETFGLRVTTVAFSGCNLRVRQPN
jgi:hypothetical protein